MGGTGGMGPHKILPWDDLVLWSLRHVDVNIFDLAALNKISILRVPTHDRSVGDNVLILLLILFFLHHSY